MISRSYLLRMRKVLTNVVEEIKYLFYVQKHYLESRIVHVICRECGTVRKATYINITRLIRVAGLIPNATDTHS
jgi:hypothetical protein